MKTLQEVTREYKNLGDVGFIVRNREEPEQAYQERVTNAQKTLVDNTSEIEAAITWIKNNLEPATKINVSTNSYTLKHYAEKETGYISNGVFILAALMCGYECEQYSPNSINGCFNISAKKIKELKKAYYGN